MLNVSLALCVWFQSETAGLMLNSVLTSHFLSLSPFRAPRHLVTWRRCVIFIVSRALAHFIIYSRSQQSINWPPKFWSLRFRPALLEVISPRLRALTTYLIILFFLFWRASFYYFFSSTAVAKPPLWSVCGFFELWWICDFFSTWCTSTGGRT